MLLLRQKGPLLGTVQLPVPLRPMKRLEGRMSQGLSFLKNYYFYLIFILFLAFFWGGTIQESGVDMEGLGNERDWGE